MSSQADTVARGAFGRLCAMGFLAYCSYAICRAPLLPLLARELGADAPTVGLVVGASTLTGIVLKLPAGTWSDILGRRPLLVAGAIVFAVMPLTYLGVASLGTLIALRFVHGSATAIFGPVASASLSDIAPANRRATWLSTYSTVQGAGQALAPIVAGYLIGVGRYDLAFVTAALLAATTPLLAATWPATAASPVRAARTGHWLQAMAAVAHEPLILATSLAQAAQFVLNGTLNAFLPLFAREVIGLNPFELGWLFAAQTVTTLAARPLMGIVSDRTGRRAVIVSGLLICIGAVLVISSATSAIALVIAVVSYAGGVAVTTAGTTAFITDLSRGSRYGAAHGLFGTIYDIGDAAGPIAAGLLVASIGYTRMFRVMAAVALIATAVFYLVSRSHASRIRICSL